MNAQSGPGTHLGQDILVEVGPAFAAKDTEGRQVRALSRPRLVGSDTQGQAAHWRVIVNFQRRASSKVAKGGVQARVQAEFLAHSHYGAKI